MNLRTSEPYWLMKNGCTGSLPPLDEDITAEVCVIGAGITGALASYALAKSGVRTVTVDKRHPGLGSTAASTALLQYEIDEPLHELIPMTGAWRANESYRACHDAIDAISAIIEKEGVEADFQRVPSLQYASSQKDVDGLKREYQARRDIGLEVEWLEAADVLREFNFKAPAGLRSRQGARVDAYKLARALLALKLDCLSVYDPVKIDSIECGKKAVTLRADNGCRIRARDVVVACGYESRKFLPLDVMELSITYAFSTKPVPESMLWKDNSLIWETKTPYLYARTTGDHRIIAGGRDDEPYSRKKRDANLRDKTKKLVGDVKELWPDLDLHPDFIWAGAFGGTRDGLAYVGGVPSMPHVHFILGLGGNGIVFSQTGAELVRDKILGRKNPRAELYSFDR